MKRCSKCGEHKPLSAFRLNRAKADGLQSYCRPCQRAVRRAQRLANPEARRAEHQRQRARDPERPRQWAARWKAANREAVLAHQAVHRAVRRGALVRPSCCERCGREGRPIHAHHRDYAKPLEVEWLCVPCHGGLQAVA